MKQLVLPIKDSNILHEVQDTLLNNFRYGRRNYTIFQVGKATLLRVSDVLALRRNEIFNDDGTIKKNAYIRDKKTDKPNTLYLKPVNQDLIDYLQWLNENKIQSDWLFPSIKHPDRHITEKQFYKIMAKTGDLLGINYLGTHTMRKTGAYRVYTQTNYNIGLVMSLLNHSSEAMTLKYLGLDQVSREQMLDKVSFD
ncbi:site-specific integrase [Limosilactobacillus reuteri]|uniref:Integrase n=2 Tax=Limosilactobacillus reuteri TaxID=1598 RepID=F8DS58_LIMRS|nr:site-specific integrase [Limosilactobacillus reuteri]AEI58492.1 integrase [Limosilactobacillus reuteri SD2112]EEI65649.1 site-specific recombinase, phage integrase family [Limosilactobacillus reuteri CF48-3A]MBU5983546.1 site-specific integrase [Limosilactobacillus reuteri]MCC4451484.1 site-specific integrase [Limosilactobacillus reuteri]MCC4453685.1 site-specific integrase [Limosilactobacillus reuteri]